MVKQNDKHYITPSFDTSPDPAAKAVAAPSVESLMLRFMWQQVKGSHSPLRDDIEAALKLRGLL